MQILFTRHGESEANIRKIISNRDLPHHLTETGVSQSTTLAGTLTKWNIKKVISSPIIRANETGRTIAEKLGTPLSISNALREFDCGIMEGRSDNDAWAAHDAAIQAWDKKEDFSFHISPDGESYDDMKARFLPFIETLIKENSDMAGDILLVSHGSMLLLMLPLILVNVDRAFTKQHPLGNCELIVTRPQGVKLLCTEWAGTNV